MSLLLAGTATLVQMALGGELSADQVWMAVRGAEKYRRAMADGDVSSEAEAAERCDWCAGCDALNMRNPAAGIVAGYCGPPFEEAPTTCGCLVTVNGRPAGKTLVRSEKCPRRRWKEPVE